METVTKMPARSLQYYVIGEHWASDLEFFRIETAFLHKLIDDYFVCLLDETNIERLSNIGMKLYQLEKDEARVSSMLSVQLNQLELMVEDGIFESIGDLAGTQVHIENLVTTVMYEYKAAKKEIFELIEKVMKSNKALS
jgi:hypothetical protein